LKTPGGIHVPADERIGLAGYLQADALSRSIRFSNEVAVPAGVRDLARDQPPSEVTLIATKAGLVVRILRNHIELVRARLRHRADKAAE